MTLVPPTDDRAMNERFASSLFDAAFVRRLALGGSGVVIDLSQIRRIAKAIEVLKDITHPQFAQVAQAVDTALALDEHTDSDPTPPRGIARPGA